MKQQSDIAALVLAAGYSSRMGEFKPLLPVGKTTALDRAVGLFLSAGIQDVRVVVGYRAQDLIPLLDSRAVRWILNEHFEDGMFSSVMTGVSDLGPSIKAFFLLPVDTPLVRRTTVLDILSARELRPADVWYPTFMGKRGHPPLLSTGISSSILEWGGNGGLRGLLQQHELNAVEIEVADEYVLADMDTPQQYQCLLAAMDDYDVPSTAECMVLLSRKMRVDSPIIAHSSKVAQIALHLARELNEKGCNLNEKLIVAAALLHDMAKGQSDHPAVAARTLVEWGYPGVAAIVGAHMDPPTLPSQEISHEEVVCLADKMVLGDRMVTVEERFRNKAETFAGHPAVAAEVSRRLAKILAIRERLCQVLGSPGESLFLPNSTVPKEAPDEGLSPETWRDRVWG